MSLPTDWTIVDSPFFTVNRGQRYVAVSCCKYFKRGAKPFILTNETDDKRYSRIVVKLCFTFLYKLL